MLIALLISLIFASSQGTSLFTLPEFDEYVKKSVKDKSRKDQIIDLINEFTKESKSVNKNIKLQYKQFWELTLEYDTPKSELSQILGDVCAVRLTNEIGNLDKEIAIKILISEVEWKMILDEIDKAKIKSGKADQKTAEKYAKAIDTFVNTVKSTIDDVDKVAKIESLISIHEKEQIRIANELSKINFSENDILRDLSSSSEDLESLVIQIKDLRNEFYALYLNDRYALVELVEEDEWNKIVKKFNDLY